MSCYHPISAFQKEDGSIVFAERGSIRRSLELPCGQCIGCRLERSRRWAVRCMHEASLYDSNCFVTLTYRDSAITHVRGVASLDYADFQRFIKRLRRTGRKPRFFMCGEYGEQYGRPHFHACIFNCLFPDRILLRPLASGCKVYSSAELDDLWSKGFASIGDVTFESAAYVARYCIKKVTGRGSAEAYKRVNKETGEIVDIVPEFAHMLLKPGIGFEWYKKFKNDVYANDYVIVNGRKTRPPRYYDLLYKREAGVAADALEYDRYLRAAAHVEDQSVERLAVREKVELARLSFKHRSLE